MSVTASANAGILQSLRYAEPVHNGDSFVIEFTATTHPGNRYQHNEDAIGWSEKAGLWFVADGMGGHARGDIASATVKKALLGAAADAERPLTDLIMVAHEAVVLEGIEHGLANMGSTAVVARVENARLTVAWCGDSRAYLWRSGELLRITRDHSLVEQLLESGVVTPDEAFGHPRRNVLVQALGINDPRPVPSECSLILADGDLVLLSSDGLHDELRDETIAGVMQAFTEPEAIVAELERLVLRGDARDNLSIVCLSVDGVPEAESAPLEVPALRAALDKARGGGEAGQQEIVDTLEVPVVQSATVTDSASAASFSQKEQGQEQQHNGPFTAGPSIAEPKGVAGASAAATANDGAAAQRGKAQLGWALGCVAVLVLLVILLT